MFPRLINTLVLLLLLLNLFACGSHAKDLRVAQEHVVQGHEDNKPPYIESVWPPPDSVTSYGLYSRFAGMEQGVGFKLLPVVLNPDLIERDGHLFIGQPSLSINGSHISNDVLLVSDGLLEIVELDGQNVEISAGPYWYSWTPDLSPGHYEALVAVTDTLEIRHEYSWAFDISE